MLITEITINYKRGATDDLYKITSSQQAYQYLSQVWSDKIDYVEESYVILLSRSHVILGYSKLSQGGTTSTIIDVKMVAQLALKTNAHGLILSHNHPSGNLSPSAVDIQLTKKLKSALDLLDISLLDHLILTSSSYCSLADEGIL